MKKAIPFVATILVAVALAAALCQGLPCRRGSPWFPIPGGYVNLSRVATIRSAGNLVAKVTETTEKKDLLGRSKDISKTKVVAVLLDGPITAESVAAAKAKLAKLPKGAVAEGQAELRLDRIAVPFTPVPAKADAAALSALLDDWLRQSRAVDGFVK